MKAIQAVFDENPEQVKIRPKAEPEKWPEVCRLFNDDVERVGDIGHIPGYTGLYRCFDENNQGVYYLVEEDRALYRMRRRHFLGNIGYKDRD